MPIDVDSLIRDETFKGISSDAQQRFFLENIASGDIDAAGRDKLILRGLLPKDAPTTEQFAGQGSAIIEQPTIMQTLGRAAKQAAPSVLGAYIGEMASPFLRIPPQVGASLGGAAGETLRQAVSGEGLDAEQIGMAAAVPAAARGITSRLPKAARLEGSIPTERITRRLPGSSATIAEMAREEITELPGRIRDRTSESLGGQSVDDLFNMARRSGALIPTESIAASVQVIEEAEGIARRSGTEFGGRLGRIAKNLKDLAQEPLQTLETLDVARRRIGALIGTETNQERRGLYKLMYRGIVDAIDEAADAGVPGAQVLKQAVAAQRRYFAADDLEQLINRPGIIGPPRPDGLREIRVGRMLDEFDRAVSGTPSKSMRLFADSFTGPNGARELSEIRDVLAFWNERVSALPPVRGQKYGSGPTAGLGALGFLAGGSEGAAMAIGAERALSVLLSSRLGRAALRERLTQPFAISGTELVIMAVGQEARSRLRSPIQQGRELLGNLQGSQPALQAP